MTTTQTHRQPRRGAFSLVELVLVLSVFALLSGVVVPRVTDHMRSARDADRLQDLRRLRAAIEQFRMDRGVYPTADTNPEFGNWDVSHDGSFIRELVEEGYLDETVSDPVDDGTYHYRYYVYAEGSYGCEGDGPFFVLGLRNFESEGFETKSRGFFRCATRDWGDEFAYVTGGGASWTE